MVVAEHRVLAGLLGLGSMLLLCVILTAGVGGAQESHTHTSLGKNPNDRFQATANFAYFRVYQP